MEKQIIRSPSSLIPILLILLSIALTSVLPSVSAYRGMVGGRKEVENVKSNREVQELGQFSVEEFNHRRHDEDEGGDSRLELMFAEVVKAEVQVVAGLKYYLKVKVTTGGGESRVYDSVVVVKPWLGRGGGSKKLLSFSPSAASPLLGLIPLGGN